MTLTPSVKASKLSSLMEQQVSKFDCVSVPDFTSLSEVLLLDVHSEAVQAALERHSERKMAVLLPSKRQSLIGQTSMDTYTPPDSSSGSDAEGSLGRAGGVSMDSWISRALHGSPSTSSSSSSHSNSSANAARLAETNMHSYSSKNSSKYSQGSE
ncbi:disco-interacting protein 2 homolog C-like [Sinocyclocheilus grahami]|uniref:disco-interacting protein 2 homolog C-like n=1 Tax=Sinocyclocheilus grahami TaxID=75366 RepID=UPI0007AD0CB4|nr:PREDICTED: disco-interacting protein 2 homolog C-like [Sinocyclocheilus grahami]